MSVDLSEEISQDAESSRDSVKSGSGSSSTSKETINGDIRKVREGELCVIPVCRKSRACVSGTEIHCTCTTM